MNCILRFTFFTILILTGSCDITKGQTSSPDNLSLQLRELENKKGYQNDTLYYYLQNRLSFYYANNLPDSAIKLLSSTPEKLKKIEYYNGEVEAYKILGTAYQTKGDFLEARRYFKISESKAHEYGLENLIPAVLSNIGNTFVNQGNYTEALNYFYKALKIAEEQENNLFIGTLWNNIGVIHFFQGKLDESLEDYNKKLSLAKKINDVNGEAMAYNNIGETYLAKNEFDNAIRNFIDALSLAENSQNIALQIASFKNLGSVYSRKGQLETATNYLEKANELAVASANKPALVKVLIELATNLNNQNSYSLGLKNGLQAVKVAKEMGQNQLIRDANKVVSESYESLGDGMEALKAFKEFKSYEDSINNLKSQQTAIRLKAEFDFSKKELEYQRRELQKNWIIFSVLAALATVLFFFWLVNRNRKRAKRNNQLLSKKNKEIESQKEVLENTLVQLKNTQKQLIHSEKMASLGELSAGIAHEIQNPLNFVNNFSEVTSELLDELKEEIKNNDDLAIEEILSDVYNNLKKINNHGQRASEIIKGMLAHSRSSSGVLELTDINKLTESVAKLAHQGFLAKNNTISIKFELNLEPDIPHVSIRPQEIDRVIFNLINNSFQALGDHEKSMDYQPELIVSSKKINNSVHISVKDNGPGIPKENLEKVFHPFFTTKEAGKGTGLGLSIAFEIAKSHNGELIVESEVGKGAEFTLILNY